MLTFTANFEGTEKIASVIQVTQNGSIRLDDETLVSNRTLMMLSEHPEVILHSVQVAGKRGDTLTFWQ